VAAAVAESDATRLSEGIAKALQRKTPVTSPLFEGAVKALAPPGRGFGRGGSD